jgi:glycosyltransferase involved in cell wall biosynthesis
MISFSIIIPSYNNSEELKLLLLSIQKHCSAINEHEVIVVDDASKDNSIELLCNKFIFVKYLRCNKNKGVANARNEGARISKNDILIFIDSDLIVQSDFVSILSKKFENPNIIAVSGTSSNVPANPSPFRDFWGLYKTFNMPKGQYTTLFTGQQGAIRKDIFWRAGGWDANIRGVSKEEYEFTSRLEKLGVAINYEPRFELKPHYKGFWKLVPENYRRTKKWCIIFLDRKKFDDYTSTFSGGMSYVFGALIIISGIITSFWHKLAIIFIFNLFLYFIVTFKFWIFIVRERGLLFALLSMFFHLASSLFIFSGAIHGLSYYFSSEEVKRKAINS